MPRVTVTEFTDPFCTWCWGAEPVVRRLQEVYRDQLRVEYVMGGLAEDFDDFHDPGTDAEHADDVSSHWLIAATRHGMPVDVSVWEDDPPGSTYPACVAFEAATFQGREPAHRFLRLMREAAQAGGRNVSRHEVQDDLAAAAGLDLDRFRADRESDEAREAFEADLRRTRGHDATSLPTFHVDVDGREELLRGYRPFVTFEKLFTERAPDLDDHEPRPIPEFVAHHDRVATQEVAEVYGLDRDDAEARLRSLAAVDGVEAGSGYFWEPA